MLKDSFFLIHDKKKIDNHNLKKKKKEVIVSAVEILIGF